MRLSCQLPNLLCNRAIIFTASFPVYTYDVNTNTNYNQDAEARAGRSGMAELARYLGAQLAASLSPR